MAVKGMLLDVDGTLLQSNFAHAQAWSDALAEAGYAILPQLIAPLIGMGGDKLLPKLVPGLSAKEGKGKKIAARNGALFLAKYLKTCQPTPGARALVQYMRDQGLPLVVATSAKEKELGAELKAADVDDLIENTTSSSDAEQSKPSPDIIEVALQKIGLPPNEVLMLGDTPYDVEAARRAGAGTIALRCGGHSDQELSGAIAIYDDPADLLANYAISPLGQAQWAGAIPAVSS